MADLSITATEVKKGPGAVTETYIAGESITAGQPVYLGVDGKAYKAVATSLAASIVKGLALHAATADQPLEIQTKGTIKIGATAAMTKALIYILSGTAGGLSPHTDATTPASGEYNTIIGVADANNNLVLGILNSQVALA